MRESYESTEYQRQKLTDYVSLTVGQGKITERQVRGGEVIAERELDSIPESWPSTRDLWYAVVVDGVDHA